METIAQQAKAPVTTFNPPAETDAFSRAGIARLARRPIPIPLDEIVIVTKLTKVECDMQRLGLSFDEVVKSYQGTGADIARIVNSHERQKIGIAQLQKLLPPGSDYFKASSRKK